ncbi:hypothetical protein GGI20_001351 [Coemansia sp. BCRC 34301]|nr:hypothetical protein GGI20_001351 [Coemansia sp. BCRC 34301]
MSQPPAAAAAAASPGSTKHSGNNGHNGQQGRGGKDGAARNPPSQRHTRQPNRGKQNNSNQRSAATSADDESATDSQATLLLTTPTKKPNKSARKSSKQQQAPKFALLSRTAPEGEQQDLLARFAGEPTVQTPTQAPATAASGGRSSGKRNRRPQDSPPRTSEDGAAVLRTPTRRPNKLQFQPSGQQQQQQGRQAPTTIYSPTPRVGHAVALPYNGATPGRGGSPSSGARSNHYAGASFNNSPAPATLPLPPSFLISPSSSGVSPPPSFQLPAMTGSPSPLSKRSSGMYMRDEDVFDMAAPISADRIVRQQASAALSERSRQLEQMLAITGGAATKSPPRSGGYSAVLDLAQPATDMASMFQKLRLIKEMSQNRPSTVEPVVHQQLTPVYNA